MSTILKGQAIDLDAVQKFLNAEYQRWVAEHQAGSKITLTDVTKFMMEATDDLVVLVEGVIFNGPDKKATVLAALSTLFDKSITPNLPGRLRIIAPGIKFVLIKVVASGLIDYIVQKYNNGTAVTASMNWKQAKAMSRVM